MRIKKITTLALLLSTLVVAAGCQSPSPYDYTALQANKPRSILVIPPSNNTVEVNAPYTFISTITQPLAEKGYYVFPVAVIDQMFKENGLPTPEEMNAIPLQKLHEITGADAVLYVEIEDWGQKYEVIQSRTVAKSNWKLVDARDGSVLWQATAFAQQSSSDGGGGLVGAMVGALVQQIAGSMVDNTFPVSSLANKIAVGTPNRGLLPGPYCSGNTHVPTCKSPIK